MIHSVINWLQCRKRLKLGTLKIIHGHQWEWGGEPWALIHAEVEKSPVFYGHSHCSELLINGVDRQIEFGIPYPLMEKMF